MESSNVFASFSFSASSSSADTKNKNKKKSKEKKCTLSKDCADMEDLFMIPSPKKKNIKMEGIDLSMECDSEKGGLKKETLEVAIAGKLEKQESCDLAKKKKVNGSMPSPLLLSVHMARSAPEDWDTIINEIRSMRSNRDAPVDLMGTHQLADEAADKDTQRFHLLVAGMISSQTRDAVTAAAMKRLHALPGGLTIRNIWSKDLLVDRLAEILKPVGFYRQKAKFLKGIAEKLVGPPFHGCIPSTLEDLIKLPGVGPKVALLVLWVAFGKGEEGIIVDTNVRRVCCRLGWSSNGSKPDQVRRSLEEWLPPSLWPEISFMFVGFGQQVCKPTSPLCNICQVRRFCPTGLENRKDGMN